MTRINLGAEYNVGAGATKTLTVSAPAGFRVVSGGYDVNGATDLQVLASFPVPNANVLDEAFTSDYADGTAPGAPLEQWRFKVKNNGGSSHVLIMRVLVEESNDGAVLVDFTNSGSYPVTAV